MFDEPTYDLDTPTTFVVNQKCLEEGDKKHASRCMAAKAIEEAGGVDPFVADDGICSFIYLGKKYVGKNKSLSSKVRDFDRGKEIKPFVFTLEKVKSFDISDRESIEEYEDTLYDMINET